MDILNRLEYLGTSAVKLEDELQELKFVTPYASASKTLDEQIPKI